LHHSFNTGDHIVFKTENTANTVAQRLGLINGRGLDGRNILLERERDLNLADHARIITNFSRLKKYFQVFFPRFYSRGQGGDCSREVTGERETVFISATTAYRVRRLGKNRRAQPESPGGILIYLIFQF
jgi:hypothetical protein